MINENDIRRHIIAALLNEPILGQNYVDYHNKNDECCVCILVNNSILSSRKSLKIIISETMTTISNN